MLAPTRISVRNLAVTAHLIAALACATADAQERSANEVALSREQYQAGMAAARLNHWEEARLAFARAYEILPRPLILFNLAGAQMESGHPVEAAESYRRFLLEATSGPAAAYRAEAEANVATLGGRIAHARFVVGETRRGDLLVVDARPLSGAAVGVSVPFNPGDHVATLTRDGVEVARESFHLADGESRDVALRVTPPSAVVTPVPTREAAWTGVTPTSTTPHPAAASESSSGVLHSPIFWTAAVVVIAGAAIALLQ